MLSVLSFYIKERTKLSTLEGPLDVFWNKTHVKKMFIAYTKE